MPRRYRSFVSDSARWQGFGFRPGDIVISTPPKCGTTWMQMLCALLIFESPDLDRPLSLISPWLDMQARPLDEVVADLAAQRHRRFIKTHTPLDGLPFDERVTYVCVGRDPREAWLSWDHHIANMDLEVLVAARAEAVGLDDLEEFGPLPEAPHEPVERFLLWLEDPRPLTENLHNLAGMLHHLGTFWSRRDEPNVVLFHYGDLVGDLLGEMGRLASHLDLDVSAALLAELAEAATFEQMKGRANVLAPNSTQALWRDTAGFFHHGPGRQWQSMLDEDDLRRYDERVASLAEADLAAWVHRPG